MLAGFDDKIMETWTREVWVGGLCKSLNGVGLRKKGTGNNPSVQ